MNCIANLHFYILTFAGHPNISFAEFTKQEEWMSSLLSQGKTESILLTSLFDSFLHITGNAVKPVCRAGTINTLMGTLMVVIGYPMAEALTGIGKGSKYGV
jgi:hypothetical protein